MIVEFTDGKFAGKKLKIEGELTLIPAFYAITGLIKNWERPYEHDNITDDDKKEIVDQILVYNNPDFKIVFEN